MRRHKLTPPALTRGLRLLAAATLLLGVGGVVANASPTPAPAPTMEARAQDRTLAEFEQDILVRVNESRRRHGLTPLKNNERLAAVARGHSRAMAQGGFFEHRSPAGDTVLQRLRPTGLRHRVLGENLFMCAGLAEDSPACAQFPEMAVSGWMHSRGHRANLLNSEFTETGIGVWRNGESVYVTQVLIQPLESRDGR